MSDEPWTKDDQCECLFCGCALFDAAPAVSLAFKSTGRRSDANGGYWITYPDGSEVQMIGLAPVEAMREMQRAYDHDQDVARRLLSACAQNSADEDSL